MVVRNRPSHTCADEFFVALTKKTFNAAVEGRSTRQRQLKIFQETKTKKQTTLVKKYTR